MKVRDMIKRLRSDGWILRNQEGSHRQFIHPIKPGKLPSQAMNRTKFLQRLSGLY